MIKIKTLIIGAGAGGVSAAAWLKHYGEQFMVFDAAKELPLNLHNGVHYLHSIPDLPFQTDIKKITLTDGILAKGKVYTQPSLIFALQYSEKVREIQHPSSIMNIGKDNFVYMPATNSVNTILEEAYEYAGKINFNFGWWLKKIDINNHIAKFEQNGAVEEIEYENIISTVPLDKFKEFVNIPEKIELKYSPVHITNYKVEKIVPNWMINLYIPELDTPIYRASILNGICSVESIKELNEHEIHKATDTLNMFHLTCDNVQNFTWNTGKVISISQDERVEVVELFNKCNIYSIGRFGLWNRKLLIDSTMKQAKQVVDYITNNKVHNWEETRDVLTN